MKSNKLISFLFFLSLSSVFGVSAQTKIAVVPMGNGDIMPIMVEQEQEASPYLEDAIDKPMVWNKGWDTRIGFKTEIDPTVNIAFLRLEPVFGYPGIIFTGREIKHWGEQNYFPSTKKIYAKAVLMVDKGSNVQGGTFEWSLNKQGFISFHNILRKDHPQAWIAAWTDPRPGEKVWFFIMSNDDKYSSNPISFIWP